jgi:hypothetical protein
MPQNSEKTIRKIKNSKIKRKLEKDNGFFFRRKIKIFFYFFFNFRNEKTSVKSVESKKKKKSLSFSLEINIKSPTYPKKT